MGSPVSRPDPRRSFITSTTLATSRILNLFPSATASTLRPAQVSTTHPLLNERRPARGFTVASSPVFRAALKCRSLYYGEIGGPCLIHWSWSSSIFKHTLQTNDDV